jgi:hypothetical protein
MLSIVIVSTGSFEDLDRALCMTTAALRNLRAEVVAVRANSVADRALPPGFDLKGAAFLQAPPGADRATMSDLAMQGVSGHIVAIREDLHIHDSGWVAQYVQLMRACEPSDASHTPAKLGNLDVAGAGDLPTAVERLPVLTRDLRSEQSSARVAG